MFEAEREVHAALSKGFLFSPEEAWAVPGNRQVETLWSIANRVALAWSVSPEDLCAHLEKTFSYGRFHRVWHERKTGEGDDAGL